MAFVQLTVVEAEGLIAGDDDGWSDPYCVIIIGNQRKKTKIIKKSLNPRWNETFSFTIHNRDKSLLLEVWDWDAVGRDDFLGQVQISIDELQDGSFDIKQYTLVGKKEASVDRGCIHLRCRVVSQQAVGKMGGQQLSNVKQRIVETLQNNREDMSLEGFGLSSCPTLLIEKLASLTSLDLSFNQFSQWPDLTPLVHLQQLSLNGNLLMSIGPSVAALSSLIELSLTGNQLTSLPPEIGRLNNLENLMVANNQIMSICPDIGRLYKLEQLDISGNPIQSIPIHMAGCRGLEVLNASGCELVEIPEEFSLMTRLIELNLSNNQIPSLPEGIGRMTRLSVLNLMFNQLKDLPLSLGFCVGLAKLGSGITIANNPIENQDMWAKYQIGTDHLFDYLEKRLTLFGEENYEFPEVYLPPEVIEWQENSKRQPRNNAQQNYQQLVNSSVAQHQQGSPSPQRNNLSSSSSSLHQPHPAPSSPHQSHNPPSSPQQRQPPASQEYNYQQHQQRYIQQQQQLERQMHNNNSPQVRRPAQQTQPAQPVDVAADLTTKIVVLKNWAISAIRGDLKPKMVKLGNFVARTTDVRSVTQATAFAETMRPHVEKARAFLPSPPPAPRNAPVVQAGGDKLIPLRFSAGVVVDEINYTLGIFYGLLQQTSDVNMVLGIVGFLKEVTRELGYLQIAYQ